MIMRKDNGNFSFNFFLAVVGILLVLAAFSQPVFGAIPPLERAALIALYNSTAGDNWWNKSGWKTPPLAGDGFALPGMENTWWGIGCDPGNTTVQSIDLGSNTLVGTLPPELGNLANLQILILYLNQLSGSIPPELGDLVNLYNLDLHWNQLSSSIPPELGDLDNLYNLDLHWNQLSGSIPPELGDLDNLYILHLDSNELSGSIPPELSNLANLHDIDLHWNQLSGSIPPELGDLANLYYLGLGPNQLSGTIPPELGNLANLQMLYLYSNQLSGTIPQELGDLANLQYLYLSYNQLSGTIPPELGDLANLIELDLSANQISGSIPPELGDLANLIELDLSTNEIGGSIPPELGDLVNLQMLYLYSNQLSGTIPPELGNLANLIELDLSANQISGSIPPELGDLANLQALWLSLNQLSGSIPPELGNLANLQDLNLGFNRLSGSIPPELGRRVSLEYLNIASNRLSGSVPSNLTNLTNLVNGYSDLRWNALYTNDEILKAFLDSKQAGGNWEGTQTIALTDVTAASVSDASIEIDWTPILYTSDTGGYRIFYSTTPGGPYTYFDMTADKTASSLSVTGLDPGATYYFVVQTRTNPHVYNQNTVDSEYSAEVSATTLQGITISGTVIDGGSGLPGVTITLSNNGGTKITNDNGYYSLTVPYGWSGTATPSKADCNFSPANRSYSNVTVNQTTQDYTAVFQAITISGTVTSGGSGLPGVTITLSGDGREATTDDNGNYSVTVPYGWTGTATPSKPGYDFSPANRNYTNVTVNQTGQDYTAALQTITITGTITSGGIGLPGVTITLSNSDKTATTAANGNYRITVPTGWTGTVTPSKFGYDFSPANRGYSNVTVNQTGQNYTATLQAITISGTITSGGIGLPGVTINLSNDGRTATTDANGNYSAVVPPGWSGTVIPSKTGYNFSPANRNYTDVTVSQTGQDFLGNPGN